MRSRQVVCLIALSVLGAACTSGAAVSTTTSGPTTTTTVPKAPTSILSVDLSATPAGWVPVAYGDAQISVPASFSVSYPGWDQCGVSGDLGALYLGQPAESPEGCGGVAPPTRQSTTILMRQALATMSVGSQLLGNKAIFINGLRLNDLINHTSGKVMGYYAPALGVVVLDSGPLAGRVLHTLTRSPGAVALAPGPAPPIPSGWHSTTFHGLAFDSPPSWPVTPTAVTGKDVGRPCSPSDVSLITTEVALSTDSQPFPVAYCPVFLYQRPQPPNNGVEVDTGRIAHFPVALSFSKPCLHLQGLTACPATSPAYSILILKVTVMGRPTPVLVSIGLAGNGVVARTILYSLRAA
ncbi:MAG: hypothetical protein ABSE47_06790 [Acidimicrobiales bacterium]